MFPGLQGFLIMAVIIIILVVPPWVGRGTAGFWKDVWWDGVKRCWGKIRN